jgi:hypothetical protein
MSKLQKKKKMDIIHICFKTFDINLFFLKKKKICRRINFILEKKKIMLELLKICITHILELRFELTHDDEINWVLDSHRHFSLYLFQIFYKMQNKIQNHV